MTPTELYKFVVTHNGATTTHYHTSGDASVAYNNQMWAPKKIGRSSIGMSAGVEQDTVTLTVAKDHPVAVLYRSSPPDRSVAVTILQKDGSSYTEEFVGSVLKVRHERGTARVICSDSRGMGSRTIPSGRYSRSCRFALYGNRCGVDPAGFTHSGDIVALDPGTQLVRVYLSTQLDEDWLQGGRLELDGERRVILENGQGSSVSGGLYSHDITVDRWLPSLDVGDTVDLVAGCDQTHQTCASKFSNLFNFGGFAMAPERNPFGQ